MRGSRSKSAKRIDHAEQQRRQREAEDKARREREEWRRDIGQGFSDVGSETDGDRWANRVRNLADWLRDYGEGAAEWWREFAGVAGEDQEKVMQLALAGDENVLRNYWILKRATTTGQAELAKLQRWFRWDCRKAWDAGREPDPKIASHSPDFTSVNWFGTLYTFSPNQRKVVLELWAAWEKHAPEVGQLYLFDAADIKPEHNRMALVFRDNPAWGTMIIKGSQKDSFRLQEPT